MFSGRKEAMRWLHREGI